MARSLYLAAAGPESGKSAVALGVADLLSRRVGRVAVFRPVVRAVHEPDAVVDLIRSRYPTDLPYAAHVGVTYDDVHEDADAATGTVVARFRALEHLVDAVLVVGTDYTDVGASTELAFNARVALNIGAPVLGVVTGRGREVEEVAQAVEVEVATLRAQRCTVLGIVANRVDSDRLPAARARLAGSPVPVWVLPEEPLLAAPTLANLVEACDGKIVSGDDEQFGREAMDLVVAAMTLPHVLDRLTDGAVVITPGDRSDVLVGVLAAHQAESFPSLTGVILNGGFEPPAQVLRLVEGRGSRLPLVTTDLDTFATASRLSARRGTITADAERKVAAALALVEEHVDGAALLDALDLVRSDVVTPLMFEHDVVDRARAQRRHVVLPEGTDERVLRAADSLLRRGVAELTLLGEVTTVRALASQVGADISGARVVDPHDSPLREQFAVEYARLRAPKGVTVDAARDVVVDVSYFGTMMVHLGLADGMVSGAAHTTAHTVRPAFEIIRTVPGVSVVSSVFFMCLADRVLVYGDCAINPDPTADQLADIAVSSAETAERFGVQPRVAMLSYSTGASGAGADVDKVRAATELVRRRRPDLEVEGPIQYDAAVDAGVARTKLPDSTVAGRATVFIFPDLNTGNNTYKAVQRSADAVAVGPVLQGLNKPVNDLSRGATVRDIITTVAITAVQAQGTGGSRA